MDFIRICEYLLHHGFTVLRARVQSVENEYQQRKIGDHHCQ
jgi:hypothetical protein